jgi:hypothetical protein
MSGVKQISNKYRSYCIKKESEGSLHCAKKKKLKIRPVTIGAKLDNQLEIMTNYKTETKKSYAENIFINDFVKTKTFLKPSFQV